jgi:8-oxo-dGTP pyrophosphatase MutT (NUDIX family)
MDLSNLEGVGAFIYCISTQRYLFLLRSNGKFDGTWGLSGGKVDPGENLIDTLYREVAEEIGMDFSESKVIPIEKFTSDNGKFFYNTFILPVEEEFIPELNNEHRGYCWVHLNDHPKPLHPGVWRTIKFESVVKKLKTFEELFN